MLSVSPYPLDRITLRPLFRRRSSRNASYNGSFRKITVLNTILISFLRLTV